MITIRGRQLDAPNPKESPLKLILVGMEEETCKCFRTAMKRYPYLVTALETTSPEAALECMALGDVQIMILDTECLEGDALEFLAAIREQIEAGPLIVALTDTKEAETLQSMRSRGVDYIYQKSNESYSAEKIMKIVDKIYPYYYYHRYWDC
jgi:DNA-binding response OmpR family regulator